MSERDRLLESGGSSLDSHAGCHKAVPDARLVTLTARKIRHLVAELVPVEEKESHITSARGRVTSKVLDLVERSAASDEVKGAVVFCCLSVVRYYRRLATKGFLPDSDLNELRAVAAEVIAKRIIEREEDTDLVYSDWLLRRYSILDAGGEPTDPKSAIELAIDIHVPRVLSSSAATTVIDMIWDGRAMVKYSADDSLRFSIASTERRTFWQSFRAERATVPRYQNALLILQNVVFLVLYTISVNSANQTGQFDPPELIMALFVCGYLLDDLVKSYKIGLRIYLSSVGLNLCTWALFVTAGVMRLIALYSHMSDDAKDRLIISSYRVLATAAPLLYTRLLLYLDAIRFFGVILIITKALLKECVLFVVLLVFVCAGTAQFYLAFDSADGSLDRAPAILHSIVQGILGGADFESYDSLPLIVYEVFVGVSTLVLVNLLIAIFSTRYETIESDAVGEWLARNAASTIAFVRGPDEYVYIPPFNLIEVLFVLPFEKVVSKSAYKGLNRIVLTICYAPLLVCIAAFESLFLGRDREKNTQDFQDDELADEDAGREWIQTVKDELPPLEDALDVAREVREKLDPAIESTSKGLQAGDQTAQDKKPQDEVADLWQLLSHLNELVDQLENRLARRGGDE